MTDTSASPDALCAQGWSLVEKAESSALRWLQRKRLARAQELFQRALGLEPRAWRCHWGLAQIHRLQSEQRKAMTLLEQAVASAEKDVDAAEELVVLYGDATALALALGLGELAEHYARQAASRQEGDPALLANLALALLLLKQGKRALGAITNACKLDPNDGSHRATLEYVRRILDGKEPYPEKFPPESC